MNDFTKLTAGQVEIRWGIHRHLPDALRIENACFPLPWSENDFLRCLRQRNVVWMVAEVGQPMAGFMIYELHRNRLHLLSFAVHPDYQRRGIGSHMIQKLTSKLSPQRRNRLMLEVRETNVAAQLFFKSQGFRAVSLLRDFYEDTTEDAYLMQYRRESEVPA